MPNHSDAWVALEHVFSKINVASVTNLMTGGVHRGSPPASSDQPYVILRLIPRDDLQVMNGRRVWAETICDVVCVSKSLGGDAADQAARIIDDLLQATKGSTTSGNIISCHRIQPILFTEPDEGIEYIYIGGSYRITARAT